MGEASRHDVWAVGSSYDAYVGRWSRLVANEFLVWIDVPATSCWLDVGCGTGALSRAILETASPKEVCGVDPSSGFIDYARNLTGDVRARFEVGDAQALPYGDAALDAVVSGLVMNFVPEPRLAVAEMKRVARPGGTVALYVWDYAGEMQILRHFWDAAAALDRAARELDEGQRFEICSPEAIQELFSGEGLKDVSVRAIDAHAHFADFDEYWTPFLGGQGPAPGYVASLDAEGQTVLEERLRAQIPAARDGSIDLIARAWAIRAMT